MIRRAAFIITAALSLLTAPQIAQTQPILLDDLDPADSYDRAPLTERPLRVLPRETQTDSALDQDLSSKLSDTIMPLQPIRDQIDGENGYRIAGEYSRERFIFFMPTGLRATKFRLATQSALNVLPERSSVEVYVNDTSIGTITPDNFDRPEVDELPLPDGLLQDGQNHVTLVTRQVHRVFCGPEASFSLWTDIALADSGVGVDLNQAKPDALSFLAASAAQIARDNTISIRTSGAGFPLSQAASIIARATDLVSGSPTEISFDDYYAVASSEPQLARVVSLPVDEVLPDGPEVRRGGDGAFVLLINTRRYDEVRDFLLAALPHRAKHPPPPFVEPDRRTSLADLKISSVAGEGRYFNAPIPFRLPRDWLLLASQQAEIRLDYQYDHDLPEGSLLLVKVNQNTIRVLPLDDARRAGRPLETLRIPFDANLLRPGVNRLTFESLVPGDPADQACAIRNQPTFRVFGTTSLLVPDSPSMSRPNIDGTLDEIGPDNVRMSDAAQNVLPFGLLPQIASVFVTNNSQTEQEKEAPDTGSELIIGVPADLANLRGDVIDGRHTALESTLIGHAPKAEKDRGLWENASLDGWQKLFESSSRSGLVSEESPNSWRTFLRNSDSELREWLSHQNANALLIQPDTETPGEVWLIVQPRSNLEKLVASLSITHQEFDGPQGQISLFTSDQKWIDWRSSTRPLNLMEPLTLRNLRTVVGNFVTVSPRSFVIPVFLLAVCSALVGIGIAILVRRRSR